MKHFKINTNIFFLFLCFHLHSQNSDNIWVSYYDIYSVKESDFEEDSNDNSVEGIEMFETLYPDTSIYERIRTLEFISQDSVEMTYIDFKPVRYKFIKQHDSISIEMGKELCKGKMIGNKIFLNVFPGAVGKFETTFYKKSISFNNSKIYPESNMFMNKSWTILADSSSNNFGLNFYITENNQSINTYDYDYYGYTLQTSFFFSHYKGHYFITTIDQNRGLNISIYNLISSNDTIITINTFETDDYFQCSKIPKYQELYLFQTPKPSATKLNEIESEIVGQWKSNYDHFDPSINPTTFENLGVIFFQNGSFKLTESRQNDKKNCYFGNWEINEYGKFIKLCFKDKKEDYVTITNLNDSIRFFYRNAKLEKE